MTQIDNAKISKWRLSNLFVVFRNGWFMDVLTFFYHFSNVYLIMRRTVDEFEDTSLKIQQYSIFVRKVNDLESLSETGF